jgi:hypothetical protein
MQFINLWIELRSARCANNAYTRHDDYYKKRHSQPSEDLVTGLTSMPIIVRLHEHVRCNGSDVGHNSDDESLAKGSTSGRVDFGDAGSISKQRTASPACS